MKKILLLLPLFVLCACGTSSASSIEINPSSNVESSSEVELPTLDSNLFGKWYVTSTSNSVLQINDEIDVFEDGHLTVRNLTCNYVGQFGEYEGSFSFQSESKRTTFVLQIIDETLAWGFEDSVSGSSDFGYAEREPFSNEIKYSYEGEEWPMQQINDFIKTTGSIPAFEASYYRLHTGVSSLYDIDYCMVDIQDAQMGSAANYASYLNENGFSITKDAGSNFYIGKDSNDTYYLRIIEFSDDKNLCIFIYNYNDFMN